jgi:hypothetical protein
VADLISCGLFATADAIQLWKTVAAPCLKLIRPD